MSGFAIKVDLSGLGLDALPGDADVAVRPAAQAGAQVLYEEVKRNVSRIKRKTGNLASAIYQAYSADNSGGGRAAYHISWNARKAPHGHLVENGYLQRYGVSFDKATGRFYTHKDCPLATPRQVPAKPFMRPAMAAFPRAQEAMRERFIAEMKAKGWL